MGLLLLEKLGTAPVLAPIFGRNALWEVRGIEISTWDCRRTLISIHFLGLKPPLWEVQKKVKV